MTTARKLREISIIAPWQACDALESFLRDAGALGVSVEQDTSESTTEKVRAYFPANKPLDKIETSVLNYINAIKAFFPSDRAWHFKACLLDDEVWQERWKQFFRPIRVTPNIVVKPTWESFQPRGGEIILTIDPGMAFGTGLHATTRLCLESIEKEIERRVTQNHTHRNTAVSLLDVGTGSGILAIAAALLGARPVLGIDKDPAAVEVAGENVRRNHVEGIVHIGMERLEAIDQRFDLVVANIDLTTFIPLKKLLADRVGRGGGLILSGVLEEQADALAQAFWNQGLRLTGTRNREEWNCLIFEQL
jgi:ribosomal protein L11 methyltransferase